MIRFIDNLYCSKGLESKISQIKWKTVCGIGMLSTYFITLSLSENDLFDIYTSKVFKQRGFRKSNIVIIGVAGSYDEATELVANIINDILQKGIDIKGIRSYCEKYVADNI